MASVETAAFNATALTPQEQALVNQTAGADAFYNPTFVGKTAADENVFDPTYGGSLPTGKTAADENVFDPTYGGTLPTGKTAADENVFDPTYGGTLPLPGVTPTSNTAVLRPSQQYQQTFDNPLFDFESYTYNLSWHILTINDFNNLSSNPESTYVPLNCLIASGGKNAATFARNPHFLEDFYFDDFKIKTTVNTTVYNKNSNAYSFEFTIIEPNGFTLINRLLDAVESVGGQNYLLQPYLLMVEFVGYRDGTPVYIPNQTKYLPFRLTTVKTSVSAKGTEYRFMAAPYNHIAFDETRAKTPALIKVEAKTVQDLLGTLNAADPLTTASITSQLAEKNQRSKSYNELKAVYDAATLPEEKAAIKAQLDALAPSATSSIEYQSKGLCDGINAYYESVKNNTGAIKYPDIYRVVFDAEIGNQPLIVSGQGGNNISNAATKNEKKTNAQAAAGKSVGSIDFNGSTFNIKPGTNIMTVIEYAVRNSKYITDQLVDPTANNVGISQFRLQFGNNLRWFKVIPKVTVGSYDNITKRYQKFITYYVRTWTVSVKNPYAPLGRAAGYAKKYDYIFTGQNRDVIDCKLDFDMLFYLQLTADVNKNRKIETQGSQVPDGAATGPNAGTAVPTSRLQPYSTYYNSGDQQQSVRSGPDAAKAVRAADTSRDLTLNGRGDMINVKLRIVGDPHFIKQDDLFYNQNLTPNNSLFVSSKNQSLVFDDGELYVFLNFQSPTDYNDATGLAIPGISPYQYSAFTGVYKVIDVLNEFRAGKFEQILDLSRIPIDDNIRNSALNIQSRVDSLVSQGLGQLVAFGPTRFAGPLVLRNQAAAGLVNAALTGSGGGVSGLVQGLVNQVVGKVADQAVGKLVNYAKDLLGVGAPDKLTGLQGQGLEGQTGLYGDAAAGADLLNPEQVDSYLAEFAPEVSDETLTASLEGLPDALPDAGYVDTTELFGGDFAF